MKSIRIWLLLIAAVVGMLLLNTGPFTAAEHEHTLKVGKKGDVTFLKETKVGDLTLKPGPYILQHRVEGDDHFVSFTMPGMPRGKDLGEVKCKLEPLSKKVAATTLFLEQEDGTQRLTRAEIEGENTAHLF